MKKFVTMMLASGLLGGMLTFSGCGDDNDKTDTLKTVVPATVTGQTATVTAATDLKDHNGNVVSSIAAGTVITAKTGTMPSTLSVEVSTPSNGTTKGVTAPTGTRLESAIGAVDLSIPGVDEFTTPAATVNIPVANTTGLTDGASVPVTVVKPTGRSYSTTGTYVAATEVVKVTNITDFCWFIAKPVFSSTASTTTSSVTTTTAGATTTTAAATTTTAAATTTTAAPTTTTTVATTTTTTLPGVSVTVSAAGTDNASAANKSYSISPLTSTYDYTITGFATGDKVFSPVGVTPTVVNNSFTDGNVTIQYASSGNVVRIILTGLTAAQDGQLYSASQFNVVFGAGTLQ